MDSADKRLLVVHEAMMALSFLLASAGSMLNAPVYAALGIMLAGSVLLDGGLREVRLMQTRKKRDRTRPAAPATHTAMQPLSATINTQTQPTEAPRTLLWD